LLGRVAWRLGVGGADIVQVVVLERVGGGVVDDFTAVWPVAAPRRSDCDWAGRGLRALPWRACGARSARRPSAVVAAENYGLSEDAVVQMFEASSSTPVAVQRIIRQLGCRLVSSRRRR
jgi:hypothetical protein